MISCVEWLQMALALNPALHSALNFDWIVILPNDRNR